MTRAPVTPDRPDRVVPTWADPVATQASEVAGGPWGRHAVVGRSLFWTPLRVCLLFATAVLTLAWVKQEPCASGNWTGYKQYTHLCYSDTVPLYTLHGLDKGKVPYLGAPDEYPVLTGGFEYAANEIARAYGSLAQKLTLLPTVPGVEGYYAVTCLLLSLCAFLTVRAVLGASGRRPWDAAAVALSPVLLVHAFTNWDLWAVALSTLGLWAWARRRPAVAGVLIGLGTAAKLYPVLLLGVLLLLCLRSGRVRAWAVCAGAAAGAWLVVDLPVALRVPGAWSRFFLLNASRPADPDSLWNLLLHADPNALDGPLAAGRTPTVLNAVVAACLGLWVLGLAVLALRAPVRPRVAQLAFLAVAGFLLLNKVWSPQYSLWLLPLAVLARPRWRMLLAWQATEAVLWVPRMLWYLGTGNKGIDVGWFFLAVGVRDIAVLVLAAFVVRDVLRPDGDVVRTSWPGTDDPAGGVLDHAADVRTLRPRSARPPVVPVAG